MTWDDYYLPTTGMEAVEILAEYRGAARIIAGGTDLMVQHRSEPLNVEALVDIGRIPDLQVIKEQEGRVFVGSAVTHRELADSPLLQEKGRVLCQAARTVGSPQIRNVGTVGGNVVTAQPAADAVIALVALDAVAHITAKNEEVTRPIGNIFLGPGKCAVDPSRELVTSFSFLAPGPGEKSIFVRFARRESLALPLVNLGLWLKTAQDGLLIEDIRIAAGPMGPVPFRAIKTETLLKGARLNEDVLEEAALSIGEEVNPRDSFRGGALYKKKMVGVFLKRAIKAALEGEGVDRDG